MTPPLDATNPLEREFDRADGATYVVKAARAGETLREYGISGGAGDLVLVIVEMVSVGFRHYVKPGWTVGVFLWRRRRLPRLVHKERLPPTGDPAGAVELLVKRLEEGWRPRGL